MTSTSTYAIFRRHEEYFLSGCSRLVNDYSFPTASIFLDMPKSKSDDVPLDSEAIDFDSEAIGFLYSESKSPCESGTIFVIPNGKKRDITLETCVYAALSQQPTTLNHWFLLTSSAREQYWLKRNKRLSNILSDSSDTSDESDTSDTPHIATDGTGLSFPPPPCVSVVTFERLGVLGWFADDKNHTEQIKPKQGILAIDEAHLLVPYLRTHPTLADSLFKRFGRIFHFTYNIKLCDLGYLLQTFDCSNNDKESKYIKDFPTGDDEEFQKKYVKHEGFHTVVQWTKQINGKLFDFAVTAAILVNIARIPGIISWANKWADMFSVQSINSTTLKTKRYGKYSWDTHKSVPSLDQPTNRAIAMRTNINSLYNGDDNTKQTTVVIRVLKPSGSVEMQRLRSQRKLGTVVHVHTNDVVSELLTDTVEALICFSGGSGMVVSMTLLSWVDSLRPGTAGPWWRNVEPLGQNHVRILY